MKRLLTAVLLVGLLCFLLTACGGNRSNSGNGSNSGNDSNSGNGSNSGNDNNGISDNNGGNGGGGNESLTPTEAPKKERVFFDWFLGDATMTGSYAFLPAKGDGGARYFDVASRTDVLFCFEPNCEHLGGYLDPMTNTWHGDHCVAHSLGSGVFYLTDECGYYFDSPNLIRTDRQGMNQKTIAAVEEPFDMQMYELYTDEYYCSAFVIAYEHIKDSQAQGEDTWLIGDPLEKRISGVVMVSLTDGSSRYIFRDGEHYDTSVTDLYEYGNHLYFVDHYCDVPFSSLRQYSDDMSDWQEVDRENQKHKHAELYDYDIATGELRMIFRRDDFGTGFRFGDGFILEYSDHISGEGAKLYRMDGELIRELPWKVSDSKCTDGTPIFSTWDSGVTKYRMYDIDKNEVLREIDIPDGVFSLNVAVGNSYYGLVSGNWSDGMHAAYIAAEDFWSGAFDRAVVFHVGPEE